jgi:oligosaccharide reducing-end xylanase
MVVAMSLPACTTTVDSLGYNRLSGADIHHLTPLASYPNAFRDLLGHSQADIDAKITMVFDQLFYGDANTQAIYFPLTDDAYIKDTLHNDIRTEGVSLGMNIAVQLNRRNEFDRLWTYARSMQQIGPGSANQGYYSSFCEDASGAAVTCVDPFGYQQFVTALLFANDRWGSNTGQFDYASEAAKLLNVMRLKQEDNGGIVDGVTDTFDATTRLAYDVPNVSVGRETRPAVEMPGYYALWREATGDPFWTKAATSARAYWQAAANPSTGLLPVRAAFDGTAVMSWNNFQPEGYRAQLNMVLDRIWAGGNGWEQQEADTLLQFFNPQGPTNVCKVYSLDGTCVDSTHEPSLVVVNGITAAIASPTVAPVSSQFVDAVWNFQTPTGDGRYYAGVLELIGLMILGGEYVIW